MKIIRTPNGTLRHLKSEAYQEWLSNLKPGSNVLIQEFTPQNRDASEYPFEHWRLYPAIVQMGDRVVGGYTDNPYNRNTGHVLYRCDYTEWVGDVFPTRIIPFSTLTAMQGSLYVACMSPIYEPNFSGCTRLILVADDREDERTIAKLPYKYKLSGKLSNVIYHAFVNLEEGDRFIDPRTYLDRQGVTATLLYSEQLN